MFLVPDAVFIEYFAHLNKRKLPGACCEEYKKWLHLYLDFCGKYPVPEAKSQRVRLFTDNLQDKSREQRNRAAHAISLYFEMQKLNNSSPGRLDVVLNGSDSLNCGATECESEQFHGGGKVLPYCETIKTALGQTGLKSMKLQSDHQTQFVMQESPLPSKMNTRRSNYSEAG